MHERVLLISNFHFLRLLRLDIRLSTLSPNIFKVCCVITCSFYGKEARNKIPNRIVIAFLACRIDSNDWITGRTDEQTQKVLTVTGPYDPLCKLYSFSVSLINTPTPTGHASDLIIVTFTQPLSPLNLLTSIRPLVTCLLQCTHNNENRAAHNSVINGSTARCAHEELLQRARLLHGVPFNSRQLLI
jgi:hypothetical protein